jgi:cytochrome c biogenesis protein CcdA
MSTVLLGFISAFWLGILTSISPCPLATNIAAVSFLSRRIAHQKAVFWSGLFYTIGRTITYAVLGFIIIGSLLSIPTIANFLQKYMNKALGPILIIVGLFLLDVLKFNIPVFSISQENQHNLANSGIKGSFALGLIFALSFCPVSAALFFGSLIPLCLNHKFGTILPFIYGIATGLPVLIFALFIAFGIKSVSKWFSKVTKFEIYARKITGAIFILVGAYYILAHIFYLL